MLHTKEEVWDQVWGTDRGCCSWLASNVLDTFLVNQLIRINAHRRFLSDCGMIFGNYFVWAAEVNTLLSFSQNGFIPLMIQNVFSNIYLFFCFQAAQTIVWWLQGVMRLCPYLSVYVSVCHALGIGI